MSDTEPPSPTQATVIAALHSIAATRALSVHKRCQDDLDDLGYDLDDVLAILANLDPGELRKSEEDDAGRPDWIAVLRVQLEGESVPFYIKVALKRPELIPGRLLSFKIWT